MQPLEDISPLLSGAVDGMIQNTFGQLDKLERGIKRTAEGVHLTGEENFRNVGSENIAAYEFAKTTFEKVVTFEVDAIDNPLTQTVLAIVSEYTTALPEWVINETLKQGALKVPEKIDSAWLIKITALRLVENISQDELLQAAKALNSPIQRIVGKQIGKKFATAISLAIATSVTKKIMAHSVELPVLKRRLARLRQATRKMKGGLGQTLILLLKSQGILDNAGEASRKLQQSNPRLWNVLRYRLNGANMVYFLIAPVVQEYIDRLELLQKSPSEFAQVMEALIRSKNTPNIFFPGTLQIANH